VSRSSFTHMSLRALIFSQPEEEEEEEEEEEGEEGEEANAPAPAQLQRGPKRRRLYDQAPEVSPLALARCSLASGGLVHAYVDEVPLV
jgi:hypothetical protein